MTLTVLSFFYVSKVPPNSAKTEMNESAEIFSTPKLINGEGDGIKNITVRRRVPVPSSRKFNASIPPNETMRIKIGNALSELQERPKSHACLKKSRTVADLTPTKRKVQRRPVIKTTNIEAAGVTLHATPRPVDGEETATASSTTSRRCPRERAVCAVYQRLLLCVWRRWRERHATLTESCGRQQAQITQLKLQVDVLKNLRNSESERRKEAVDETQQLVKKLEILNEENINLNEKIRQTQDMLAITEEDLKLTKMELVKSSEQVGKLQELLRRKKEERTELLSQISKQEYELLKQNSLVGQLEEQLQTTLKNLQNSESNFKAKQEEYSEAIEQLQNEMSVNCSLSEQLATLQDVKEKLECQTEQLESKIKEYSKSCEELLDENISMRCNLNEVTLELDEEKQKTWLKNAREIASLSFTALQKVAYIMLPAYLDRPLK